MNVISAVKFPRGNYSKVSKEFLNGTNKLYKLCTTPFDTRCNVKVDDVGVFVDVDFFVDIDDEIAVVVNIIVDVDVHVHVHVNLDVDVEVSVEIDIDNFL